MHLPRMPETPTLKTNASSTSRQPELEIFSDSFTQAKTRMMTGAVQCWTKLGHQDLKKAIKGPFLYLASTCTDCIPQGKTSVFYQVCS